jgi:hypothetical protein
VLAVVHCHDTVVMAVGLLLQPQHRPALVQELDLRLLQGCHVVWFAAAEETSVLRLPASFPWSHALLLQGKLLCWVEQQEVLAHHLTPACLPVLATCFVRGPLCWWMAANHVGLDPAAASTAAVTLPGVRVLPASCAAWAPQQQPQ